MKLGIIGAMAEEVENLISAMTEVSSEIILGTVFSSGNLKGTPAVIVQCGIGKVNAAICAQILCSHFYVTHIVNTGIAGALADELNIGDIVVSADAVYHDVDVTHFGYAYGQVPGLAVTAFPADEKLLAYAFAEADRLFPGKCKIGRIASGDQFIADNTAKSKIRAATCASCVEMEGAAIAHTAFRNRIPFVVIRAISDKADNSAEMDYPEFEKLAAARSVELVMALTERFAEEII